MAQYELTLEAKEDLWRIYEYGRAYFGEEKAERYYDALYDKFAQIAENPYMYPEVGDIEQGYRRCVCGQENIYYRIIDKTMIQIVRILGMQSLAPMDDAI